MVSLFQQIVAATPNLSDDLATTAAQITEPGRLADFVAGQRAVADRRPSGSACSRFWTATRGCIEVHRHLTRELELLELRGRIQSQVQGQLSQSQREFYLREQLKAIQKELGEGDEGARDVEDLREEAGSGRACRRRSRRRRCAS